MNRYSCCQRSLLISLLLFFCLPTTGCFLWSDSPAKLTALIEAPTTPEFSILSSAMENYDSGLFTASRDSWMELRDGYPHSPFVELAELKIADSFFYSQDYKTAVSAYNDFQQYHKHHEAIPYVLLQIGSAHKLQYKSPMHDQTPLHEAVAAFKQLVSQFPKHQLSPIAKDEIKSCQTLLAQHERQVAEFYEKLGHEKASKRRYSTLRKRYKNTEIARNERRSISAR